MLGQNVLAVVKTAKIIKGKVVARSGNGGPHDRVTIRHLRWGVWPTYHNVSIKAVFQNELELAIAAVAHKSMDERTILAYFDSRDLPEVREIICRSRNRLASAATKADNDVNRGA